MFDLPVLHDKFLCGHQRFIADCWVIMVQLFHQQLLDAQAFHRPASHNRQMPANDLHAQHEHRLKL